MTIFLALLVIPLCEISLILSLHHWMKIRFSDDVALIFTIGTIILTGYVGAKLAKSQGMNILREVQSSLSRGQVPQKAIAEGLLVLIGGILLLTPGYITDLIGLTFLFPYTRRIHAARLERWFLRSIQQGKVHFYAARRSSASYSGSVQNNVIDVSPDIERTES